MVEYLIDENGIDIDRSEVNFILQLIRGGKEDGNGGVERRFFTSMQNLFVLQKVRARLWPS